MASRRKPSEQLEAAMGFSKEETNYIPLVIYLTNVCITYNYYPVYYYNKIRKNRANGNSKKEFRQIPIIARVVVEEALIPVD